MSRVKLEEELLIHRAVDAGDPSLRLENCRAQGALESSDRAGRSKTSAISPALLDYSAT